MLHLTLQDAVFLGLKEFFIIPTIFNWEMIKAFCEKHSQEGKLIQICNFQNIDMDCFLVQMKS